MLGITKSESSNTKNMYLYSFHDEVVCLFTEHQSKVVSYLENDSLDDESDLVSELQSSRVLQTGGLSRKRQLSVHADIDKGRSSYCLCFTVCSCLHVSPLAKPNKNF